MFIYNVIVYTAKSSTSLIKVKPVFKKIIFMEFLNLTDNKPGKASWITSRMKMCDFTEYKEKHCICIITIAYLILCVLPGITNRWLKYIRLLMKLYSSVSSTYINALYMLLVQSICAGMGSCMQ